MLKSIYFFQNYHIPVHMSLALEGCHSNAKLNKKKSSTWSYLSENYSYLYNSNQNICRFSKFKVHFSYNFPFRKADTVISMVYQILFYSILFSQVKFVVYEIWFYCILWSQVISMVYQIWFYCISIRTFRWCNHRDGTLYGSIVTFICYTWDAVIWNIYYKIVLELYQQSDEFPEK